MERPSIWGRWEYRTSEGWIETLTLAVIGGERSAGYIVISFFALIGGFHQRWM